MIPTLIAAAAALRLLGAAPSAAPSPGPPEDVLAVLQRMAKAMEIRDTAALRGLFEPGARLVGLRPRHGGPVVQSLSIDQFVAFVAGDAREAWVERFWNPEVRVEGTLATVWAPYDFHFASRFSHCGVDAFQLLRTADGWRIVSLADTYQPDGCPRHPPPAP